jgi:hypothetical protein
MINCINIRNNLHIPQIFNTQPYIKSSTPSQFVLQVVFESVRIDVPSFHAHFNCFHNADSPFQMYVQYKFKDAESCTTFKDALLCSVEKQV